MTRDDSEKSDDADAFIEIGAGEAREIAIAGLVFRARLRRIGDDGGPSLEILAPIGDAATELIRFDIFDGDPHFHAPASDPMPTPLAALPLDCEATSAPARAHTVERLLSALPEQLAALLERAGQPQLARGLDTAALRSGTDALRSLLSELRPPETMQRYPLTPKLRSQLGLPGSQD